MVFTCFWPTLTGLRFDILYILWIKPISRVLDPKFKIQTSKSYKCLVALWTITANVIFEWDHVHIQQTHTCRPQSKWICLILFNSQINKALFFLWNPHKMCIQRVSKRIPYKSKYRYHQWHIQCHSSQLQTMKFTCSALVCFIRLSVRLIWSLVDYRNIQVSIIYFDRFFCLHSFDTFSNVFIKSH